MRFIKKSAIYFAAIILLFSCNSNNFKETPIDRFIGVWELQGRSMFNGIEIKIEENSSGKLIGKVISLNDNKYVEM